MYRAVRRALFLVAPERIHTWVFALLRAATAPKPIRRAFTRSLAPHDPVLASTVFGVRFPGPLGLAAGFDKNGRRADRVGCAGLRVRRGRHRDRAAAARQPGAEDVSATRRQGVAQPAGIQQPRRGRAGAAAGRSYPGRADRGQHRQDQDRPGRGRRRRLPGKRPAGGTAGGVPGGQRQLAEHAGPARPAGRRVAAADSDGGARRDDHAGPGKDRAGSVRLGYRRDRRSGSRIGACRNRRDQHDDLPRRPQDPRRCGAGTWRHLRAAGCTTIGRGAAPVVQPRRRPAGADQCRWHRNRRRRMGPHHRRSLAVAGLHRLHLRRRAVGQAHSRRHRPPPA